jgi:ankyrin repeat protein
MIPRRACLIAFAITAVVCGAEGSGLPLVEAARSGNREQLRSLIEQKKVDVNASEADGSTALHWASHRDDSESALLLIRAGANVNSTNDLGVTPLWSGCQNGSAALVQALLEAGADPNLPLLKGETPVMVAARSGFAAIVGQLLGKGANPNARGPRGQTALMWAAAQKRADVVEVLVRQGADIHARSAVWSQMMAVPPHGYPGYNKMIPHGGQTALLFAAREGDLASARLLVGAGANVNDADAWGVSATVLAAHSGFTDLVEFLLEKGADANMAKAGFAALHCAIMRRDERMVRALLAHGADPSLPLRTWTPTRRSSNDYHFEPILVGATPFWLAARFLQPNVMRLLAERGADPRFVHRATYVAGKGFQQRSETTTALMAAAGMGGGTAWVQPPQAERQALTLEAVKLALELGVDINATNEQGRTALDAARAAGLSTVVNFLVQQGVPQGNH